MERDPYAQALLAQASGLAADGLDAVRVGTHMDERQLQEATAATVAIVSDLGLSATTASVLHNSNKLALRIAPCNTFARVAEARDRQGAAFEVELAQRLAATVAPVAALEPRVASHVHLRAGFVVTLWTSTKSKGKRERREVY